MKPTIGWAETILILTLGICGWQDVRQRRVRNWTQVALLLLTVLALYRVWPPTAAAIMLSVPGWIAAVCLYLLTRLGPGDVKVLGLSSAYGFAAYGLSFLAVFALCGALDWLWAVKYPQQAEARGVPLLWAWAWSWLLFALATTLV